MPEGAFKKTSKHPMLPLLLFFVLLFKRTFHFVQGFLLLGEHIKNCRLGVSFLKVLVQKFICKGLSPVYYLDTECLSVAKRRRQWDQTESYSNEIDALSCFYLYHGIIHQNKKLWSLHRDSFVLTELFWLNCWILQVSGQQCPLQSSNICTS